MNPIYDSTYGNASGMDPALIASLVAIWAGMMLFLLVMFLVAHIFLAVCLMKIAKKTNTENAWFAWVPVLNIILIFKIGKQSAWWTLLLLTFIIPFVNFFTIIGFVVISVMAWMKISERLGKPSWLGIIIILPLGNLVIPGYLAFSKSENTIASQSSIQQTPIDQSPIV